MLQGWETSTVRQTSTPTKPIQAQASEPAREAPKEQEELARKPKFQPELDHTLEERKSP